MKEIKNNQWKIIKSPLIEHNLTTLRKKDTSRTQFCQAMVNIAKLLVNSVTKKWQTKKISVETPFTKTTATILAEEIILVPIMRAGLALLEGFKELIPEAKISHIGLYRNQNNFQVCEYYFKFPKVETNSQIIVLDPMVATAKTAITAIQKIQKVSKNCEIHFVSIIASQYAKKQIEEKIKGINIYTVNIDPKLNEKKYIVPGFGDAGDRFFGTK